MQLRRLSRAGLLLLAACHGSAAQESSSCAVGEAGIASRDSALLQLSSLSHAGVVRVDPRQHKADAMIEHFQPLIQELDLTIKQCEEGIDWLNDAIGRSAQLWAINAMVPFVGQKAKGCNLDKEGLVMQEHPPSEHQETCVLYCGEMDCNAALTYMSRAKAKLKAQCHNIVYLQGGALCFVEKEEPLQDRLQCQSLVQPAPPGGLASFLREAHIQSVSCNSAKGTVESLQSGEKSFYIWNTMVPVFGEDAEACNLRGDYKVHGEAPTSAHDVCLLYCGESSCPQALQFMKEGKGKLSENCREIKLLDGGAKCFLQEEIEVESKEQCRGIVSPDS